MMRRSELELPAIEAKMAEEKTLKDQITLNSSPDAIYVADRSGIARLR
jgi:hypothetical protein